MNIKDTLKSDLFDAFANASDKTYIYVTDMKNDVTRWSQSAVDYFGLPSEYINETDNVWIEHVHPEDRQVFTDDIDAVFSGKSDQHNCQYRARNRYGEYTWVECKGSVIKSKDGSPDLFAGIMTRLDNQNIYDPITHLPTGFELIRTAFNEDGALMVVGIDGFRKINGQYGLSFGNKVLIYLGELLSKFSGDYIVYRFQGDEFVVYGKNAECDKLKKIFESASSECANAEEKASLIDFTITAGITSFKQTQAASDIIAKAEVCFNYAKENCLGSVAEYSEDIEKKQLRKQIVSEDLLNCIKQDFKGFRLVYQPILANNGNSVVACESLLRWTPSNPEIGNCYPDEFISILEANGGMTDVGYFVMQESIRQAAEWQKKYKKFNVSFNVSYVQLEDQNFVPSIIETIEKYNADPNNIVVELTESILNVDTVKIQKSFDLLRKHHIQIALDDFGTGNSSFWMLHNIDVDIVKLDQSFIRGLDTKNLGIDYAIVESIGLMCNRIGCQTVAEGIETEAIWKLISRFEFTGLQGYLFSKPIEVPNFEDFLESHSMSL